MTSQDSAKETGSLLANRSFWGLLVTQFLGAFNDNVYKQLVLLLAIPVAATSLPAGSSEEKPASLSSSTASASVVEATPDKDRQAEATILFSLPFVLFSGYAGFLSDRYRKSTIIVLSKVAEIVVMILGTIAFAGYGWSGYPGLLCVLFFMGMQSSFFGPPKYGALPQMVTEKDLPRANGLILMTTFLAIIFGMVLAGGLGKALKGDSQDASRLWLGGCVCIGLAVAGTLTSLLIRPLPAQSPSLKFAWDALAIPRQTRALLSADRPLLASLFVSSLFWLVSGIAVQAVNSLGKAQLQLDDLLTSSLQAIVGVGIMVGSVLSGMRTRDVHDFHFARWGAWGIVLTLAALAVAIPHGDHWQHWLGYRGALPVLGLMGMAAGMFAVPIQVFLQTRPPEEQKGRVIAVMNLVNFIAIMLSGVVYHLMDRVVTSQSWPRSFIFGLMALLMVPVLLQKNAGLGEISDKPVKA